MRFKVIVTLFTYPNFSDWFKVSIQRVFVILIKYCPAKLTLIKIFNTQFTTESSVLQVLI